MTKFKEKLINVNYHEELDFLHPFYNDETEEFNEIDDSEMPSIWSDTVSMDIDEAINTLKQLKEEGANRVYIVAHTDHVGYIYTGVKLEEVK